MILNKADVLQDLQADPPYHEVYTSILDLVLAMMFSLLGSYSTHHVGSGIISCVLKNWMSSAEITGLGDEEIIHNEPV